MANDMDIGRTASPTRQTSEWTVEIAPPQTAATDELSGPFPVKDEKFETEDVSEKARDALQSALNEEAASPPGRLVIERDEDTGRYVQKLMDPETGDVIRQWPEEEFLELAKSMGKAYGLFFDKSV